MDKNKTSIKIIGYIVVLMIVSVIIFYIAKMNKGENELNSWIGKYEYVETFEHSSGEMNYYVSYEIIIYEDNAKYYAELIGNGWFLQTRTLAYISGTGQSIQIIFKQTLPGDIFYGKGERYEPEDLLISFKRVGNELQTEWNDLRQEHPILCESDEKIEGSFFEKSQ